MQGSSEAVTAAIAEELADAADLSFFSKGAVLPPLLGPAPKFAIRASAYWSGVDSFHVSFKSPGIGSLEVSVWTDERGLEALIGDLQATLVRARLAKGSQ